MIIYTYQFNAIIQILKEYYNIINVLFLEKGDQDKYVVI